jgi:hypothetical protein
MLVDAVHSTGGCGVVAALCDATTRSGGAVSSVEQKGEKESG